MAQKPTMYKLDFQSNCPRTSTSVCQLQPLTHDNSRSFSQSCDRAGACRQIHCAAHISTKTYIANTAVWCQSSEHSSNNCGLKKRKGGPGRLCAQGGGHARARQVALVGGSLSCSYSQCPPPYCSLRATWPAAMKGIDFLILVVVQWPHTLQPQMHLLIRVPPHTCWRLLCAHTGCHTTSYANPSQGSPGLCYLYWYVVFFATCAVGTARLNSFAVLQLHHACWCWPPKRTCLEPAACWRWQMACSCDL